MQTNKITRQAITLLKRHDVGTYFHLDGLLNAIANFLVSRLARIQRKCFETAQITALRATATVVKPSRVTAKAN